MLNDDPEDREEKELERRSRHIEELTEKLKRLGGESPLIGFDPDCPDEAREKFLEQVIKFEGLEDRPLFDALLEGGVQMPRPEELDDRDLTGKLWEVIRAMELFGHFLHHTDHLSDRELYRVLWTDTLREPTTVMPENPEFACFIDIIGSGSHEDLRLYLKYYADEDERRDWAEEFPEDKIPEHVAPPYDRDRHLPGAEYQ